MTTETLLTDEEIITIGHQARAIEQGENGYILPFTFARAIEQAVLQSPEIQELRNSLGMMTSAVRILSRVAEMFADELGADLEESKVSVTTNGNEVTSVSIRKVIDKARAAMEKQE